MSLRLLVDEDVPSGVIRALRRRIEMLDHMRVQDVGLRGSADAVVLGWAAETGRVTLTCDRSTMIDEAARRVHRGDDMPGLVVLRRDASSQVVIADLELVVTATSAEEWSGQIGFVPI